MTNQPDDALPRGARGRQPITSPHRRSDAERQDALDDLSPAPRHTHDWALVEHRIVHEHRTVDDIVLVRQKSETDYLCADCGERKTRGADDWSGWETPWESNCAICATAIDARLRAVRERSGRR